MSSFKGRAVGSSGLDRAEVLRALAVFADPEHNCELRGLPSGRSRVRPGSDREALADAAAELSDDRGVYFCLGPVSHADDRAARVADVVRRRWLLVDVDPVRPKDTNATDGEKAAARGVIDAVRESLVGELGWPAPVEVDSGNGYHLLFRIDLPNDEASRVLCRDLLHALAERFDTDLATVDRAVHNASRISKLPGTVARKGLHSADRPHRTARLLRVPEPVEAVSAEQLRQAAEALRADAPARPAPAVSGTNGHAGANGTNGREPFRGRAGGDAPGPGYLAGARDGEAGNVLSAPEGNRNNALNKAAFKLGTLVGAGLMTEGEAVSSLFPAGLAAGLGELETRRTIASGLEAGKLKPRVVPARPNGAPPAAPRPTPPPRPLPYVPFPACVLPPVMREFVAEAARAMDVDPAFVALPALAAAASAVGNSRALHVKRSWSEPCCLWAMTVAGSGSRKSPGWAAATAPLVELQMSLYDAHRDAVAAWRRGGADEDDRPAEPPALVTSDATIESVGELLRDNPRGLLVSRDELDGWFGGMTRYKGKAGGTDRPHWLELSRAGTLILHRITREKGALRVRRALASVTGTIQPGVLARSFDREAMDAGLAARFLLAMPPRRRHRWTEDDLSEATEGRWRDLIRCLLALPMDGAAPHFLGLSRPAREAWVAFYDDWAGVQFDSSGAEAACYAKIEGYALRLMLLHQVVADAADGRPAVHSVTRESAEAGILLARWFGAEAVRVYALLAESDESRSVRELCDWIASAGGEVTARELQRRRRTAYPTSEAANAALEAVASAGLGVWLEAGPGPGRHARRLALSHPCDSVTLFGGDDPDGPEGCDTIAPCDTIPGPCEQHLTVDGSNGCVTNDGWPDE